MPLCNTQLLQSASLLFFSGLSHRQADDPFARAWWKGGSAQRPHDLRPCDRHTDERHFIVSHTGLRNPILTIPCSPVMCNRKPGHRDRFGSRDPGRSQPLGGFRNDRNCRLFTHRRGHLRHCNLQMTCGGFIPFDLCG